MAARDVTSFTTASEDAGIEVKGDIERRVYATLQKIKAPESRAAMQARVSRC
jgi:hypothetical protein